MKRIIKNSILVLLIFTLVGLVFSYKPSPRTLTTDSGWDSDYDSGWDSDSDWDSDSSWDWDDNDTSHSSSSSGSSSPFAFSVCVILIIILVIISVISNSASSSSSQSNITGTNNYDFDDISDEEFASFGIENISEFKEKLYKIFTSIQIAWMNFDYDSLAKLCSDELYNSYKRDLETLSIKNGKNIMSDFTSLGLKVTKITKNANITTVYVYLHITFYDYVINTANNNIIRGTKNQKVNNHYYLEFTKQDNVITKCPSCGGDLENSSNTKCPHCGNTITNNNNDYVLAHKERI